MIAWMVYAVLVAAALSGAALAAERAARVRRRVTRWIWFGALLGSLAMPVAMATVSFRVPDMLRSGAVSPAPIVLRDATSIPMPALLVHLGSDASPNAVDRIGIWIRDGWAAASLAMLLMLMVGAVRLQRRKRDWVEATICGERVLVSPDVGPAVAGLLRPRIVVPAWLLEHSASQQRTVLAHERSHLDAGDTRLLAQALLLLLLMPWNPMMWWQFRRLRNAIEVDCDARVLRGGGHLGEYCETLIQVGERQVSALPLGPTMSAPCSFLEQRIKLMLMQPKRWAGVSALLLVAASLGMAAFAAQVTPPNGAAAGVEQTVTLTPSALDRYTGFYKVSDISRVAVTRAGNGLVLDISAQAAAPKPLHAVPLGADRFAVQGQPAVVRFSMGADGRADRLDIEYKGRSALDVPRTSRAEAERIEAALHQRIQAQKPYPGSVKALKLLLSDPVSGAGMSEGLAHARVVQRASREAYLAKLGPVQSYTFTGVNRFGDDVYLVRHAHGDEHMTLVVAADGTVTRAFRYR
ncbi:M56 family metallopeptidase [Oleiagrimonas soli]|uniref:Beta-lactamase regulating signal transducer with metallopeptidase domain n=1 Tax=Oleiagrimonas soli TaxID=1543381 RepID=A0A099CWS8_9GAMM|nr:M56 family metallopeptidase [Oleiagrimonas soli]KGI78082.1 membrane protein [Oleiagrimonas soli]MBB6183502.1 beta-lactamase regulating signal transducer with metallopeptidase domain [Oleiagrimonas soli]